MVQLFTIITFAVVVLVSGTSGQGYNQKSCLYSGREGAGEYLCLNEAYVAHLQNNGFDNRAYSFCANGIYLYYDYPNFNAGVNANMEYVFGPNNYCGNFQNIAGRVSSMRFAGDPKNYRTDSLTLYVGTYFQGEEEYLLRDASNLNLDLQASSLIVTGVTGWTLYDKPSFQGNALCVYPPKTDVEGTPALINDSNSIGVPNRTIRSVRKGCYGKRRVFAEVPNARGFLNQTSDGRPVAFAPSVDPAPIQVDTVPFVKESA